MIQQSELFSHEPLNNLKARDRIVETAYRLFSHEGLSRIGIDRIIKDADVAKASLYNHFGSKEELIKACLKRSWEHWFEGWMIAGVEEVDGTPEQKLLAVFDLFEEWFTKIDPKDRCLFMQVQIETNPGEMLYDEVGIYMSGMREAFQIYFEQAHFAEPATIAHSWGTLIKGCLLNNRDGENFTRQARIAAQVLLASWPRLTNEMH
jgi:AcrR family transcriptional regulator